MRLNPERAKSAFSVPAGTSVPLNSGGDIRELRETTRRERKIRRLRRSTSRAVKYLNPSSPSSFLLLSIRLHLPDVGLVRIAYQ